MTEDEFEQERLTLCRELVVEADKIEGAAPQLMIDAELCITLQAEELKQLRAWKAQVLEVERQWDVQAIGKLIGVGLGQHIRPQIQPAIENLIKLVDALKAGQ